MNFRTTVIPQKTTCSVGVDRDGEFQPCDNIAVSYAKYFEGSIAHIAPVCVFHTRKANAVPLDELDNWRDSNGELPKF